MLACQLTYPSAYIAAPFTSVASVPEKERNRDVITLFDMDNPHGIIKKGAYRNMLNGISRRMKGIGFSVVLPHRDINDWGRKILSAKEVFDSCTQATEACDLFISFLGFSHGSHYEFGIARGLNKPIIIISPEDAQQSFIAQGIRSNPEKILILKCERLNEAHELFSSLEVRNFLKIFFPLEELT